MVTGSGMAAISAIVLATVQQGQRILASNRLYGRTVQLFTQELSRFGVTTEYVDVNDLELVEAGLEKNPRLLFVETMSNPLLRVVDIAALAELAHDHRCLLVVDNTFATPVLTRPMGAGADFVMESLTKMIAGHSDVTLGLVCQQRGDAAGHPGGGEHLGPGVEPVRLLAGGAAAWRRSIYACGRHADAARLADWLAEQPGVTRVYYPGRADHPDHDVAERVLDGGFGHMLCFELAGGRDGVNRFLKAAPGIPFSPSLGHSATTLSHPATTSHRYVSPAEKKRQGISDGLIRLSVGVEPLGKIQKAMAKAFEIE